MTKNQAAFFRTALFLFGIGIVALAFFLTTGKQELSKTDIFNWISIFVMYLVFFTPFFFSSVRTGNFSGKIPSLGLVWTGVIGYIISSIIIIVLSKTAILSLNGGIIAQSVIVFLFIISVYFAYFANAHVQSVAAGERAKSQYVSEIKQKASLLLIAVNSLPQEYERAQTTLKSCVDDIKYISPANDGDNLELEILGSLNLLESLCATISEGGHPASFETEAGKLQTLIKQRKLLRN
jgi:hypothetical protein